MLISLAMLITSTISTTYGYIVTSTDPIVNTLMPQEMQEKGFYITKKIEHPFGASYKIPDNIKFDFKVELGEYYANAEITTTAGFIKADSSGNLYVSLKPGKVVYIDQLTQGSTFKVTEISSLSGFSAKGGATKKVKADSYGTAKAEFVNVYASSAVKGENISVGGVKILEGRDWQEGDSFSFVLEQKNGGGWDKLGEKTVAYDADKADYSKFDFSDIFKDLSFDSVGTYTFRISEVMGNLENVDYDQTVNHFTVKVTDPALLEKTGGIIQGMSGSVILQNDKIIGAVTHVLVNDPTTGYGIFIENMLNNM